VAIARALVVRPQLILADEPTGNLDSGTAEEILGLLERVQQEFSATLLIATHDQRVADTCEGIVRVRDGRVTRDGVARDAVTRDAVTRDAALADERS
jgi:putative ABC transport system ATP-binding protein